jgi:hypothetical protein
MNDGFPVPTWRGEFSSGGVEPPRVLPVSSTVENAMTSADSAGETVALESSPPPLESHPARTTATARRRATGIERGKQQVIEDVEDPGVSPRLHPAYTTSPAFPPSRRDEETMNPVGNLGLPFSPCPEESGPPPGESSQQAW